MAKKSKPIIAEAVDEILADIRTRMETLGLSQAEVAKACGWQQPLVSQYLGGSKEPGAANLVKLAHAVGCRLTLIALNYFNSRIA